MSQWHSKYSYIVIIYRSILYTAVLSCIEVGNSKKPIFSEVLFGLDYWLAKKPEVIVFGLPDTLRIHNNHYLNQYLKKIYIYTVIVYRLLCYKYSFNAENKK